MTTDTPTPDRTPLDLDAIEEQHRTNGALTSGQYRALLAEVTALHAERDELLAFAATAHGEEAWTDLMGRYTALRAELDKARKDVHTSGYRARVIQLEAELDAARAAHERALYDAHQRGWNERGERDAARAEQEDADTRAAMRNLQDWDAADHDHDGIDWGDHLPHPAARAERTEPATGDDVEVVAQVIEDRLRDLGDEGRDQEGTSDGSLWIESPSAAADDLAACILAALDLPGRKQALRERLAEDVCNEQCPARGVALAEQAHVEALEASNATLKADRDAIGEWLNGNGFAPTDEDTCMSDWVIGVFEYHATALAKLRAAVHDLDLNDLEMSHLKENK